MLTRPTLQAALFDKAAGVHVRFRLGGSSFPPTLLYKVFLSRPLCDVGAFAPRDYTSEKLAAPRELHSHPSRDDLSTGSALVSGQIRVGASYFGTVVQVGPEGMDQWYRRVENNDWRPITYRVLRDVTGGDAPPGSVPEHERRAVEQGVAFHYSRVKRQDEVQRRRKAKKRRWLMRMYQEGLAKERASEQLPTGDRILAVSKPYSSCLEDDMDPGDKATVGLSEPEVKRGHSPEEDRGLGEARDGLDFAEDDVEQLLEWSSALDYDAYVANWHVTATSAPSGTDFHPVLDPAAPKAWRGEESLDLSDRSPPAGSSTMVASNMRDRAAVATLRHDRSIAMSATSSENPVQ